VKTIKHAIATTELLLVFPAALFMAALFLRELQPPQYEPARSARRLVEWFSGRPFIGLDLFLVLLPLAALVIGCVTILRSWRNEADFRETALGLAAAVRRHLPTLLIAAATLAAGGILAIVAMHMITE
jgi:hypothetical protein